MPEARARDPRRGLSGMPSDELAAWFLARGEKAFRAKQVEQALWGAAANRAADLTTLPQPLATAIDDAFRWSTVADEAIVASDGGQTEKVLHRLSDGATIESVLMHYPARAGRKARHTLCISSQGGCAVGCPFCATGELGFERDLETAEILDQVRSAIGRLARAEPAGGATSGPRLTNVVFMGMGEPLLNLDRVLEAVAALNDPAKLGLGARHITVSTSGVVPGIRRLTALGPQFTLAISLHAARDSLRDVLVPLNRRWPVAEVVAAARDHARETGRRISYEMTMIDGVNDTDADADAVAVLLKGDLAHVNLIPMNPVAHTPMAGEPDAGDRALRGTPPGGRPAGHDPPEPWGRDRCSLRPAGSRTGRDAGRPCRRPTPDAPGAGERTGTAWRTERGARARRGGVMTPARIQRPRPRRRSSVPALRREPTAHDAPSTSRARVAVSILDSDLGNLAYAINRAEREGADRIHLDVMDGHFVPNITFGAKTIAALRRRTRLPFDAHLMISTPGRFIAEFLDAGCDSVTIHVEIQEDIEPTLKAIRAAGRAAGLCVKPKTPLSALEPYRKLLDIVMVMTVEPGFGGQEFMADVAKAKLLQAREILSHKLHGGEIHVDGGVNRDTAELIGSLGVDILVVGSALWIKGRNMGREIRLIRALADEGYQFGLNNGVPPIPRDRMVTFATLRRPQARTFREEIEAAGIPVLLFRSRADPADMDDDIRRWDLLLPASAEAAARERFEPRRRALVRSGSRSNGSRPTAGRRAPAARSSTTARSTAANPRA